MVHRGQDGSKKVLSKERANFCALRDSKYIGTVFSGRATHWWVVRVLAFSLRDAQPPTRPVRTGNTGPAARNWPGIGRRLCAWICTPGRAASIGTTPHTYFLHCGNQRWKHSGRGVRERCAAGTHHVSVP